MTSLNTLFNRIDKNEKLLLMLELSIKIQIYQDSDLILEDWEDLFDVHKFIVLRSRLG